MKSRSSAGPSVPASRTGDARRAAVVGGVWAGAVLASQVARNGAGWRGPALAFLAGALPGEPRLRNGLVAAGVWVAGVVLVSAVARLRRSPA